MSSVSSVCFSSVVVTIYDRGVSAMSVTVAGLQCLSSCMYTLSPMCRGASDFDPLS